MQKTIGYEFLHVSAKLSEGKKSDATREDDAATGHKAVHGALELDRKVDTSASVIIVGTLKGASCFNSDDGTVGVGLIVPLDHVLNISLCRCCYCSIRIVSEE